MQRIRVELSDLDPAAADRLIDLLHQYLLTESADIHLEVRDLGRRCVCLPTGKGQTLRLPFDQIRYVTADRHRTIFCLGEESPSFRINFSEAAALLPAEEFLDCSRGVLLNLRHIREAKDGCFVMDDGAVFPIRRRERREILLRYEQFRLVSGPAPAQGT